MGGGLAQGEDGGDAGVAAVEDLGPLVAGAGAEGVGDQGAQFVPAGEIRLAGSLVLQAHEADELGVEPRLQRADRHVAAVGGLVHVVERGAAVEQVGAAAVLPVSGAEHGVDHRREMRGAVHDGGVHGLALAGRAGVVEGGEDADDEVEGAPGVVAEEVGGDRGRAAGGADHAEGAGDGDVADVVAGGGREGAVLAPAGHPPVHQPGVAGAAVVGADAQPLGDAGAVALDQDVGPLHEVEDGGLPVRVLEVEEDGSLVAVGQVVLRGDAQPRPAGTVDAYDVGPEVGEEHRGEGTGSDSGELHHPDTVQRTCARHRTP
ncbi:hypothetical protein SRB5_48780 [Streptomyces sp. RB5]|uniref:Uncharacterized protein n=1 Tax=Streptomyces smaragdinus TaxID=2585196 RepID=A0A7K0CNU8_9ACTN|nr:hypothetical protein [Streptomyces smaragdinus]